MGSTLQVVCCSKEKEELERETLVATDNTVYANIKHLPITTQHSNQLEQPIQLNQQQTSQPQQQQPSQTQHTSQPPPSQPQQPTQPQLSQSSQPVRNTNSNTTILGGQYGLGYY